MQAVAYLVYVTSDLNLNGEAGQSKARLWKSGDPLVHTLDFVISASADALPGGPGRLRLERVTVPPEASLPPQTANPWSWTEVGAGTLGLTLVGEHLPSGWPSGTERTFPFGGDYVPQFLAPGTTMQMRNAGETPLVLYRLTLLPAQAGTPGAVIAGRLRPPSTTGG